MLTFKMTTSERLLKYKLNIHIFYIHVLDETADIITFGRSAKRDQDLSHIGMYGNGLKS